ncbi:MAG: SpoIIE family protein phosphatase [Cyanobacteriota bacterium]|nr:SpoIIE family protein phosphatase [Cyanobacteriota bacterium]
MKFSFALKVGFATTALSITLTSTAVYWFYSQVNTIVQNQITGRLRDIGYMASFQFEEEDQAAIRRLQTLTEEQSILSTADIQGIPAGEFKLGLVPAVAAAAMQTPDFQRIVQLLRRIEQVSQSDIQPLQDFYPQADWETSNLATYLMVNIPEFPDYQFLRFIGSSRHEEIGDWPGNPLGNTYAISDQVFARTFGGEAQTTGIYKDIYGTWITAALPIKNSQGEVLAVLGVDYNAQTEANQLRALQYICYAIILAGLVLSILLSALIARWLGQPITQLRDAAEQVQAKNFDVSLAVKSQDELGLLAQAFNSMIAEIRSYAHDLETKVTQRTHELQIANAEISNLYERLKEENLRMGSELEVTRKLQQLILPKEAELERIPGLDIAGFMEPANEVGGDYYDVLQHNGRVKIGIGDVTGHGLESGMVMIMTQMAVRTLLKSNETDSRQFINILNQAMYDNIQRMGSDKNLTLALLDYYDKSLTLTGQHEEMIVVRTNGDVERIDTIDLGFPVGLESEIKDFIFKTELTLEVGDVVVLYTDGVTEAENPHGELYGLERLCRIVQQYKQESAAAIRQAVIEDVRGHIGTQKVFDDITLLVLKQK